VGRDLGGYDVLVVPGGFGTRALIKDADFIRWLQTSGPVALKASVCTGALLLGAAGFLRGRRATTHPAAYAELAPYCAQVIEDSRVVDEGPVVTSRGVTAAIDLGLHLVSRLAGLETCEKIRRQMDYPTERVSLD
jgi:cyclohexyl-isocyanide hydratase